MLGSRKSLTACTVAAGAQHLALIAQAFFVPV
jgi:hypothetical protein